jgi:hypothetical protein
MNGLWTALYSRLTAATAVTSLLAGTAAVYDTQAPQEAHYPLIIFQQQAGDVETVDPHTRHAKDVTVKVITVDGFKKAETIDAALNTALDDNKLSVTGHTVIWQRRTADVRYVEVDPAGRSFYHVGGIYHIWLGH